MTNTNDPGEAAVPATPIEPPVAEPAQPVCGQRDDFSPRVCDRPTGHDGAHDDSRYPVDHDWSATHGPNKPLNPPPVPPVPVLTQPVDDDEASTDAEARETVERLGIDVPAWAAEIRAKVAAVVPPGPVPLEGEPVEARCNCVLRDASEPHDLDCPQRPAVSAWPTQLSEDLEWLNRNGHAHGPASVEKARLLEDQLATAIRELADEKAAHDMTRDAVKCAVDCENAMRAELDEQRGRAERAEREAGHKAAEARTYEGMWKSESLRTREGRQFLHRLAKYVREDRAVTPGVTRLARLADQVDAYLQRTNRPEDVLCDDEGSECNNQRCAQADAINAAVERHPDDVDADLYNAALAAGQVAADAFREWIASVGGAPRTDEADQFEAWLRSGADAPGAGKDGAK